MPEFDFTGLPDEGETPEEAIAPLAEVPAEETAFDFTGLPEEVEPLQSPQRLPSWDKMKTQLPDDSRDADIKDSLSLAATYDIDPKTALTHNKKFKDQMQETNLWDKAQGSLKAGMGDVYATLGSALKLAGMDEAFADVYIDYGERMREAFIPPEDISEFTWRKTLDPEWWATTVTRSIPFTVSLVPAAVIGAYGGTAAAGVGGLGAFGTTVMGSIGAAGLSRPMESMLEGGAAFEEALGQGRSREEAESIGWKVAKSNMALVGLDAAQFATAFTPLRFGQGIKPSLLRRMAAGTGKLSAVAVSEAGEERYQEYIQMDAMGEDANFFDMDDPRLNEASTIGGIFGLGMGGAGSVWNGLKSEVTKEMPEDVQTTFDTAKKEAITEGLSEDDATLEAFDAVSDTPEGKAHVEAVMADIQVRAEGQAPEVAPEVEPSIEDVFERITQEDLTEAELDEVLESVAGGREAFEEQVASAPVAEIKQRLLDTGMDEVEASSNAALFDGFRVLADRAGLSTEEVVARYLPQVTREAAPVTEVTDVERAAIGDNTFLSQRFTTEEQLSNPELLATAREDLTDILQDQKEEQTFGDEEIQLVKEAIGFIDQRSGAIREQPGQEAVAEGEAPRGRIRFAPAGINIELLKGADQSTFVHETGHLYFRVMRDLSSLETAAPQLKQDFETVRDWLGITEEQQGEITREQEEQFARGFEAFLREGKAPTPALRQAFENFKQWLTEVYQSLLDLDVTLSDDIRGVMDRMLADEGVEVAEPAEARPSGRFVDEEGIVFEQGIVQTDNAAFEKWSEGGEVVEPEDVNDHKFKQDEPVVLKVFHGTTHDFDAFDAKLGNLEGQFGAINYFTSSESDASDNYAGEGPDLTSRIENLKERLDDQFERFIEEFTGKPDELDVDLASAIDAQFDTDINPLDIPRVDNELDGDIDPFALSEMVARTVLSGGEQNTLELFVKTKNPFVIGENAEWIEFVDNEAIQQEAIEQVADSEGISAEEVEADHDKFEEQVDEARWDIEAETPNELIEAIETVSNRHDVDASNLAGEIYELGSEATPEAIEKLLRSSEDYVYAEGPEGELIGSQLIAEVIEEMGFDSIILKNAEDRFGNMNIEGGTAHVHVFDSSKTNIKSVENLGTFDPSKESIFEQAPRYESADTSIANLDVVLDEKLPTFEGADVIKSQPLRPNQKDRVLYRTKKEDVKNIVNETIAERGENNIGVTKIYRALYAKDFEFGEEGHLSPNPNNPHETQTDTPVIASWWVSDPKQAIAIGDAKTLRPENGPVEIVAMDVEALPDEIYLTNITNPDDLDNVWMAIPQHLPEQNISRHDLTAFQEAYRLNYKEVQDENTIRQGATVPSRELQRVESLDGTGAQRVSAEGIAEPTGVPRAVEGRPEVSAERRGVRREGVAGISRPVELEVLEQAAPAKINNIRQLAESLGGIDFNREHLKGELKKLTEDAPGTKFLINKKDRGVTLDDLLTSAIDEGILDQDATLNDVLSALEVNLETPAAIEDKLFEEEMREREKEGKAIAEEEKEKLRLVRQRLKAAVVIPRKVPVKTRVRKVTGQVKPSALKQLRDEYVAVARASREAFKAGKNLGAVKEAQKLKRILARARKIKDVRNYFGLTDAELKSISRKNPLLLSQWEFKQYLDGVRIRAAYIEEKSSAKAQLMWTIYTKDLGRTDNYRRALGLPTISNMTTKQLEKFTEALEPFHDGDVFLSERELQTVDRTDLAGIRTWREAKERLAKELGVPMEELEKIKVKEWDEYKWDSALMEANPFYKMLVTETSRKLMEAEVSFHDIETEVFRLAKASEKSRNRTFIEKAIPQDNQIMAYIETPIDERSEIAETMTPQQLDFAHYIESYFQIALEYLIKTKSLDRGRQNYFVHMRKSFLENTKDNGLIRAFKDIFKSYQEDEATFNIMDEDTGNILPLEKFFQFTLRRTGGIDPTTNVTKAFLTYAQMMEKKIALDELIPKVDIYAQSLTPTTYTPRGLEIDRSIKKFVNKYINNKKGRRIRWVAKQGGTIDVSIRGLRTFTTVVDLGLNIPTGIAAFVGEQVANFQMLGTRGYTKGTARIKTAKGKRIINKYEAFIGRSSWEEFTAPGKLITERITDGLFGLFHEASVLANKQFLLGTITQKEYDNETITEERLALLKLEMGRFRVVPGTKSLVGSTSAGSAMIQYKSWAVPIIRTLTKDASTIVKDLAKKPPGEALTTREAREIYRFIGLTTTALIVGAMAASDDDDKSFTGQVLKKVYRESMTLMQGIDPSLWLATPRLMGFVTQLGKNLKAIITLEEYKTKPGLKGIDGLQRQFIPRALKQFDTKEVKGR